MRVKQERIDALIPAPYNPRRELTAAERDALKASLTMYGAVEPAVVNVDGTIIGGHQRISVAQELGWQTYPCVRVDLSENDARALNLALNKISGDWDEDKLTEILAGLTSDGFDLLVTGFETDAVQALLSEPEFDPIDSEDLNRLDQRAPIECPSCHARFRFVAGGEAEIL